MGRPPLPYYRKEMLNATLVTVDRNWQISEAIVIVNSNSEVLRLELEDNETQN